MNDGWSPGVGKAEAGTCNHPDSKLRDDPARPHECWNPVRSTNWRHVFQFPISLRINRPEFVKYSVAHRRQRDDGVDPVLVEQGIVKWSAKGYDYEVNAF
jgi:hypothetical protein